MKAAEWFEKASAEGAFCERQIPVAMDQKPITKAQPIDSFVGGKWITIWSDTGLPYNPKVHGGR